VCKNYGEIYDAVTGIGANYHPEATSARIPRGNSESAALGYRRPWNPTSTSTSPIYSPVTRRKKKIREGRSARGEEKGDLSYDRRYNNIRSRRRSSTPRRCHCRVSSSSFIDATLLAAVPDREAIGGCVTHAVSSIIRKSNLASFHPSFHLSLPGDANGTLRRIGD